MRFESIFHPITYETLIIPIKFLPIPQLRLPYIGTRADSSDLLRPLPLDTQSSWRASTLPRSPPFSPAPRPIAGGGGGGGGSGRTSSLTDAIHRVIFPFFPPFFLPPLPSWRPPSRGRCPAPTIFAISRHPIFSVLRVSGGEGRGGSLARLARGHYLIFRLETPHPQEKRSGWGGREEEGRLRKPIGCSRGRSEVLACNNICIRDRLPFFSSEQFPRARNSTA